MRNWMLTSRSFGVRRNGLVQRVGVVRCQTQQQQQQRLYASSTATHNSSSEPFYGSPRPPTQQRRLYFSPNDSSTATTAAQMVAPVMDTLATVLEQVHQQVHSTSAGPQSQQQSQPFPSKIALTLRQASIALQDPTRADAVAAVGELTGTLALQKLQRVMRLDPVGSILLQERPLVSKATIPYDDLLQQATDTWDWEYSKLTFGQAYGRFLKTHGFDPDERSAVQYLDDPELAYIMLRYRQSHDYYHALTGLPPTVVGELGLKWLELYQTGLPMTALAGVVGGMTTLSSYDEQQVLWHSYVPWAQRVGGQQMKFGTLLNVYYEREWDTPLVELQQRLGLELAPQHDYATRVAKEEIQNSSTDKKP